MGLFARLSVLVLLGCLSGLWWSSRVAVELGTELGGGAGLVVSSLRVSLESDSEAAESESTEEAPLEPGSLQAGSHGIAQRARRVPGRRSLASPRKLEATFLVRSPEVLALANSGRRPSGSPVRASGNRPSGLQLSHLNGLGLPVENGDVLTHVAGQHIATAGDVVGLVLALRGRQVARISGVFWHAGKPFGLVVEQPYPRQP